MIRIYNFEKQNWNSMKKQMIFVQSAWKIWKKCFSKKSRTYKKLFEKCSIEWMFSCRHNKKIVYFSILIKTFFFICIFFLKNTSCGVASHGLIFGHRLLPCSFVCMNVKKWCSNALRFLKNLKKNVFWSNLLMQKKNSELVKKIYNEKKMGLMKLMIFFDY